MAKKIFPDSLLSIRTKLFHPDLYLPFPVPRYNRLDTLFP